MNQSTDSDDIDVGRIITTESNHVDRANQQGIVHEEQELAVNETEREHGVQLTSIKLQEESVYQPAEQERRKPQDYHEPLLETDDAGVQGK